MKLNKEVSFLIVLKKIVWVEMINYISLSKKLDVDKTSNLVKAKPQKKLEIKTGEHEMKSNQSMADQINKYMSYIYLILFAGITMWYYL